MHFRLDEGQCAVVLFSYSQQVADTCFLDLRLVCSLQRTEVKWYCPPPCGKLDSLRDLIKKEYLTILLC